MKKAKIIAVCLIVFITGFVIFQNDDIFLTNRRLEFNFFVTSFHTPSLPVAIYFITWLLAGVLLMYFFNLYDRFVSNKEIKRLNNACDQQLEKIKHLENVVESIKPSGAHVAASQPVETEPKQAPVQ